MQRILFRFEKIRVHFTADIYFSTWAENALSDTWIE